MTKKNEKEIELKCKIYVENSTKILGIVLININDYETDPKVDINFRSNELNNNINI